LRHQGFDTGLGRVRDVVALVCVAALASTLVSASLGVVSLWLAGSVPTTSFTRTWLAWWLGDAMGALVVAPFLLSARRAGIGRRVEFALLMLALTLSTLFVFVWLPPLLGMRLKYLLMPLLAWAGVRFGPQGAAIASLAISAVAVGATTLGFGPFAMNVLHEGLFELQWFMAVLAVLSLTLGAATAERDRAHRVALDAVSARDVFLAIASHELRTPLGTMVLLLGTLRRRIIEPAVGDRVDRALRQTERLSKLVDALMDVARIDSGALVLDRQLCDLTQVVREVVDRCAGSASRAGCAMEVTISNGAHELRGSWDRKRIEQLLENLLSNAFRHAPGHVVHVSLESDGQFASVAIRDEGEGIDAARLDGIFDRFQRAAEREHGGLGLGLYIARWIADAHHGHLTVTSNPAGTVFTVVLPLLHDEKDILS